MVTSPEAMARRRSSSRGGWRAIVARTAAPRRRCSTAAMRPCVPRPPQRDGSVDVGRRGPGVAQELFAQLDSALVRGLGGALVLRAREHAHPDEGVAEPALEPDLPDLLARAASVGALREADEARGGRILPQGEDQRAAWRELRDERVRHLGGGPAHEHRVEGGVLRPAAPAVAVGDDDRAAAEPGQAVAHRARGRGVPLEAEHLAGQPR